MRIAEAFDRADHYDRYAAVQRRVAWTLADRIVRLPLAPAPSVLEIGCGTGFLGEALAGRLAGSRWRMTDIAPAMVARARLRLAGRPGIDFAVMDGAAPDIAGPFDLICSSLAMQWLPDLGSTVMRLRRLLAPDGWIAFTTLARGSFAEWRAACAPADTGTPDYPGGADFAGLGLDVAIETICERHDGAHAFLRALKAIGAATPHRDHRPHRPRQLRQAMARFEAAGSIARYEVATCLGRPHDPTP